jgi:hypothetical protein
MFRAMAMLAVTLSAVLGCVRVQPGLANAPALGSTPGVDGRSHDRGHDAIANGEDSCGRTLDPGPLRNKIPPCAAAPEPASSDLLLGPTTVERAAVLRWLEHYHSKWPCPHAGPSSAGMMLVAWPPTDMRAASCALP